VELGAQKWSRGWKPIDVTRSAILYCLDRSRVKGRRHDNPTFPSWAVSHHREFLFGLSNMARDRRTVVRSKDFLQPFPPREDVLVSSDVHWALGGWWEDPTLPEYSELPLESFR
jgi:hypothetical protein